MRAQTKALVKIILIIFMLALFSVPASYAADTESPSDEIERIEYEDNSKTTYFKNGTKLVQVSSQLNIEVTTTTTTTTFTLTEVVQPINILEHTKLIVEIIYYLVFIVAAILGLFKITLYIRSKKELPYIRHLETIKKCLY